MVVFAVTSAIYTFDFVGLSGLIGALGCGEGVVVTVDVSVTVGDGDIGATSYEGSDIEPVVGVGLGSTALGDALGVGAGV